MGSGMCIRDSAVVMSVRVPEVPSHGPGVWKFNLSVLNDPECLRVSSKIACRFLLAENYAVPHCVENFRPTFGALYRPLGVNFILLILTVQFWTFLGRSLMVLF